MATAEIQRVGEARRLLTAYAVVGANGDERLVNFLIDSVVSDVVQPVAMLMSEFDRNDRDVQVNINMPGSMRERVRKFAEDRRTTMKDVLLRFIDAGLRNL